MMHTIGRRPITAYSQVEGARVSPHRFRHAEFDGRVWYLLLTKANRETDVCCRLEEQGFTPWLPVQRYQVQHARQTEERVVPLFSRYVFAGVPPEHPKPASLAGTHGVADVVKAEGGRWQALLPETLADVVRLLEDGVYTAPCKQPKLVNPGDNLVIETGPFAGWSGPCVVSSDARTTLLLDIMGRPTAISVPTELVRAG